jgi:hypothetical protein
LADGEEATIAAPLTPVVGSRVRTRGRGKYADKLAAVVATGKSLSLILDDGTLVKAPASAVEVLPTPPTTPTLHVAFLATE